MTAAPSGGVSLVISSGAVGDSPVISSRAGGVSSVISSGAVGDSLVISSGAGGEVEKSYYLCMIKRRDYV